ncbi:MAG: cyclic nucleotide-binding domain-containing protein [Alphaproteobacteria bacterium]|nr:cyclic nucleotide-binding domain-containing protein [Alphaproteobacteria bacterium]
MSLQQDMELLRSIPMFAGMEPSRLKLLSFTSTRVSFMPGESFIRQGEVGDAAYVIVEGEAEVVIETAQGESVLSAVGKHSLIGEVALLHSGYRTATVRARSPLVCMKMTKDVFFHLLRDSPDFALAVMRDLARRVDRSTERLRNALVELREHQGAQHGTQA